MATAAHPSQARFGQPMTEAEWIALDEDEEGELVNGVLVEEEMPDYLHELIVMWLGRVLGNWLEERGGFIGGSDAKFIVARSRGRKPDISVYLASSPPPPARGGIRVPPDIVVEVISPRARDVRGDRVEKMHDYARFGVRWYWLLDPAARLLEIYSRNEQGLYVREVGVRDGVLERVPGCEGLRIDLDALWRKVDQLPEGE
jgi:Uma2 family endonuclease